MSARIAIIGGTGVYDPGILTNIREEIVKTPFGEVRAQIGMYEDQEVVFVPRHGEKHSVPPHRINYRANIWSLRELGVERAIATAAVGSLNSDMKPTDLVMVDQFLDFTRGREQSFYEGGESGVFHVDVTNPYCRELRQVLFRNAKELSLGVHFHGTYVCTDGPRFETTAEIRMYRQLGGDVVGMTSVPEVVLARELGICYATIGMVTNYAAGISPTPLTHSEVVEVMAQNMANLRNLIMGSIKMMQPQRCSDCAAILKEAPIQVAKS